MILKVCMALYVLCLTAFPLAPLSAEPPLIVAHRPIIQQDFPQWLEKVEFWSVHDLDCCSPDETLPHLDREVVALLMRLENASSAPLN